MGIRTIVDGFSDALGNLTFLRFFREPSRSGPWTTAFYPLIGLLFGLAALIIVHTTHRQLPVLCAWAVPLLWLVLSGGSSFAQFFDYAAQAAESKGRALVGSARGISTAAACAIFCGKALALLQAEVLDTRTVAFIALLAPVAGRYGAALIHAAQKHNQRGAIASTAAATLFTLGICAAAPALGLLSLAIALFVSAAIYQLSSQHAGPGSTAAQTASGAAIEVVELLALWIAASAAVLRFNLVTL